MGPMTDTTAVVDSQLKIHGLKGLRVTDVTSGNINSPCIMIGEKVSDMIKQSLGQ
jgi:choline dehydrogenase-like flavoprotein